VKYWDLLRLLAADGWYLARTRGSHQQYRHRGKPGVITIAGTADKDVPASILHSILKQSGLS